jgi:L,D-transpeptidase-like protein
MTTGRTVALITLVLVPFGTGATVADAKKLPLRKPGTSGPLGNSRLSNERTVSRVAGTYVRARIRKRPSPHAGTIGRLRYHTEDGPLEVYLTLRSRVDRQGHTWILVRVPGRPNGRTGWVPEDALGPLRLLRTQLIVDRGALRATLYRKGKQIWSSPVGVGAPATPTPAGRFWIRERLKALGGPYGPWAFGTAAYSSLSEWPGGGVVGIHGTNQPSLIPGRPSHGCIRLPNSAVMRLARILPIGTPLRIR